MGCTASKQAVPSYTPVATISKTDGAVRSWHTPLPRSLSIHTHLIHPQPDVHHDDPAVTGSFVRLLYRKKLSTPSAGHNKKYEHGRHHHQHDLAVASDIELNPFLHPTIESSDISHHFFGDGYSIGPSLQQPQSVRLSTLEVHNLDVPTGSMESFLKEGLHDQDATLYNGISFQYPEKSTTVLTSVVETGDDSCQYGGDEQELDSMYGMEDGRRDKFIISPDNGISFQYPEKSTTVLTSVVETGENVQEKSSKVSDTDASVKIDVFEDNIGADSEIGDREFPHKGLSKGKCPSLLPFNLSSPLNDDTLGGLKLVTPVRSPSNSPILSSKSASSPLFDPSLLALFEQAAEGMCHSAPMDDWILDNDTSDEPSRTLSSSDNITWISSEDVSSDADSLQVMGAKKGLHDLSFASIPHDDLSFASMPHGDLSSEESLPHGVKRQKVGIPSVLVGLEMFELRCPPRGEDKVVIYFTSLRGIRRTYQDCRALRLILQGLGVDVDERDVWMHMEFREELVDMLGHEAWPLPRLFIRGRYIGGAEKVKQLHEDGILAHLIKDLPTLGNRRRACDGCADMRFIPCLTCHGSGKLVDYELDCIVRCVECNENGLIMCPICRS